MLDSEFSIVAQAADGKSAVRLVRDFAPEIVVIDFDLAEPSGLETTRRIRREVPSSRVLIFAAGADHVAEAIVAGACGYILRNARDDEISAGIRAAARGEALLAPEVAARLIDEFRGVPVGVVPVEHPRLTERELEILRLIAEGENNDRIAQRLEISPHTVKNHVSSILDKLEASNRIQAAVTAIREHLV